jgi:RimJ/RimL family protein N-acetyltransferase
LPYAINRLEYNDLEWFRQIRNSSRHFLHDDRIFSINDVQTWWVQNQPDIRLVRADGIRVGYLRLGGKEIREGHSLLWIGADLEEQHRGHGHGRNIYQFAMPLLSQEFCVEGFILRVLPHNQRALRLYRSLGFVISRIESATESVERVISITDIEMIWHPLATSDLVRLSDVLSTSEKVTR